jgi:plastocyanin domain-containing protein
MRIALFLAVVTLVPGLQTQDPPKPKRVEIAVTAEGFSPERVEVQAGVPIELVFTRKTDKTCATEVVVPSLKLKKALPLNEPVAIPLTPEKNEVGFACGMNMLRGKLVVK